MKFSYVLCFFFISVILTSCQQKNSNHNSTIASSSWLPDKNLLFHNQNNKKTNKIIALVNGNPIYQSEIINYIQSHKAGAGYLTPKAALQALIEFKLLSQESIKKGYYTIKHLKQILQQALAQTILVEEGEKKFNPEKVITDKMLKQVYYYGGIKKFFDHYDAFKVIDIQYVCCAQRYTLCNQAQTRKCINNAFPKVQKLYDKYIKDEIINEYSLKQIFKDHISKALPELQLKQYDFFYRVNLPYNEQHGYAIMNKKVSLTVINLHVGEIAQAPVKSNNGVHILFLVDHKPEIHKKYNDPLVKKEIISKLTPKLRQKKINDFLSKLIKKYNVVLYPSLLKNIRLNLDKIH